MEEARTRELLPKIGASLLRVPYIFFLLPALLVVAYAGNHGYNFKDWHVWAVGACCGTAVFAFFKNIMMPSAFQEACLRHHASKA